MIGQTSTQELILCPTGYCGEATSQLLVDSTLLYCDVPCFNDPPILTKISRHVQYPVAKKGQRLNNCDKVTKIQTASFGLHLEIVVFTNFSIISGSLNK